ncbi:MAG: stage 0 sporulation protein [Nitrospirae bacterium]|nr:stage 0 sporulation protein [Nitrospirota bacterium]
MNSVGIRLWNKGRLYFYNPTDFDLERDEWVLVKTERALTPAKVCAPSRPLLPLLETPSLRPITRKASDRDNTRIQECLALEPKVREACREGIAKYRLDMRLSDVEILFDKSKMVISFSAEQRVDFRGLVRDLAGQFKTRIEMKQIGVRDEAGILGGVGSCGRQLCCSLFLTKFHPVTTKMVKAQNLPVNNSQLLGTCGRLKCCLAYEYEGPAPKQKLVQLQA